MSRIHCRCRHCDTRRVLPKHPDEYKVIPQCRVCGKRTFKPKRAKVAVPIFRVDGWMNRRTAMNRSLGCMCSGYKEWEGNITGAMHRKGSLRCWFRADGTQRTYGDSDYFIDPDIERMDYEHA